MDEHRLMLRAKPADLDAIDAIADALRRSGRAKYPSRTGAIRYALATVAKSVAVEALIDGAS